MTQQETYAVKLDEDIKKELLKLITAYKEGTDNTNSGDFIKVLIETYKTNKLINSVPSTNADIKELNQLTSRIYSIYSNLVERIETNTNNLQVEFAEKMKGKDTEITKLKDKVQNTQNEKELLINTTNELQAEKEKIELELYQTKETNLLYKQQSGQIDEYKNELKVCKTKIQEINEELQQYKELNLLYKQQSGQIDEYKSELKLCKTKMEETNEELQQYKELLATSQSKNIQLNNTVENNNIAIDKLNSIIEDLKNKHKEELKNTNKKHQKIIEEMTNKHTNDISTLKDKLIFDKEKSLLDQEKAYSIKANKMQEDYNSKIKDYQDRYKELLQEMQLIKNNTLDSEKRGN